MNKMLFVNFILGIFVGFFSFGAAANSTSVYTAIDFKGCKTLSEFVDENEGRGGYEQLCPGVGGYRIRVNAGDQLQIGLLTPNKKEVDISGSLGFATFVGKKAEWIIDSEKKPLAVIYRITGLEGGLTTKTVLVVARINSEKSCVVSEVPASKDDNQRARDIANSIQSRACHGE